MFKGEYAGKNVAEQNKKILILGESHYGDVTTTKSVIEHFYKCPDDKSYRFFHKIAECFCGKNKNINEEFVNFWDKVYFANYIDENCGVQDCKAKNLLEVEQNRKNYNNELFEFINKNGIDTVFVFSRLVYNYLPSCSENEHEEKITNVNNENLFVGKSRDYISLVVYLKDEQHKHVDVILNKDIKVYGFRHPSAACGFKIDNYRSVCKM